VRSELLTKLFLKLTQILGIKVNTECHVDRRSQRAQLHEELCAKVDEFRITGKRVEEMMNHAEWTIVLDENHIKVSRNDHTLSIYDKISEHEASEVRKGSKDATKNVLREVKKKK